MSSAPFTPAELTALQILSDGWMTTDVFVETQTVVTTSGGNLYGDDSVDYEGGYHVNGWLFSGPTPRLDGVSDIVATVNTYRLFLPVGTNIVPGDRCTIGGAYFIVSDTTNESTYLPLLRCSLRRLE